MWDIRKRTCHDRLIRSTTMEGVKVESHNAGIWRNMMAMAKGRTTFFSEVFNDISWIYYHGPASRRGRYHQRRSRGYEYRGISSLLEYHQQEIDFPGCIRTARAPEGYSNDNLGN